MRLYEWKRVSARSSVPERRFRRGDRGPRVPRAGRSARKTTGRMEKRECGWCACGSVNGRETGRGRERERERNRRGSGLKKRTSRNPAIATIPHGNGGGTVTCYDDSGEDAWRRERRRRERRMRRDEGSWESPFFFFFSFSSSPIASEVAGVRATPLSVTHPFFCLYKN